ncbi:MAG: DUF6165 family protein [Roseibium sp.]
MVEMILIPVSPAELIDRVTILEIKAARIDDAGKLDNVRAELESLAEVARQRLPASPEIRDWKARLKEINERLWEIEERIRKCEQAGHFGDTFVELARSVYLTNDRRAKLKREINTRLGSPLVEEKSYAG